jgi:TolA-binding protein
VKAEQILVIDEPAAGNAHKDGGSLMRGKSQRRFVLLLLWACSVCPPSREIAAQTRSTYDEAVAAFRGGDYAGAAKLFEQAEDEAPGTTDALLFAAKSLVHLQKFTEAELALRHFVAANSRSSDACYLLGYVLNRENKPKESLEMYTKRRLSHRRQLTI